MILAGMSGAVDSPLALKPELTALPTAHHKLAALLWFRTKYVTSSADEEQTALQLL